MKEVILIFERWRLLGPHKIPRYLDTSHARAAISGDGGYTPRAIELCYSRAQEPEVEVVCSVYRISILRCTTQGHAGCEMLRIEYLEKKPGGTGKGRYRPAIIPIRRNHEYRDLVRGNMGNEVQEPAPSDWE
jgi:hypothetical protein